jgi:signal transduction histidine kinase/DNA-binding response OmpR family regulator/ligand-binding sensor domain-containing protein
MLYIGSFGQVSFENPQILNKASGLSANNVFRALQDDRGFLWFSTDNGICRWDGVSIRFFYDHSDQGEIKIGNSIHRNAFCWDSISNKIIFGTDQGLSVFDPHTYDLRNYPPDNDSSRFLSSINCIYLDKENQLWLGTKSGLVNFEFKDGRFRMFSYSQKLPEYQMISKKRVNEIWDIKQDISNDSVLWLASLSGLLKFNKYTEKLSLFYNDNTDDNRILNTFVKIATHSNKKLYLGTWYSAMLIFDTKREVFESPDKSPIFSNITKVQPIIPIEEKSSEELWFSSTDGICVLNTTNNTYRILKSQKNIAGQKYTSYVNFFNQQKLVCLSSEYGVSIYNLDHTFFFNYFFQPIDEGHWYLPTSMYEDSVRQDLYLGYGRGEGLHYFDLKNNTFHIIPIIENDLNIAYVNRIYPYHSGQLFIVCLDEIYLFSTESKSLKSLHTRRNKIALYTDIAIDYEANIWVSSALYGLQKLHLQNGALEEIPSLLAYAKKKGITLEFKYLKIDKQKRIWFIAAHFYGYYEPQTDHLQCFDREVDYLPYCFYNHESDTIWMGLNKEKGLGFIDPMCPGKGIQLAQNNINKNIKSIEKDNNRHFIFCTDEGIAKYVTPKNQYVIFNEKDGLAKYDAWYNRDPTEVSKLLKLSDGRIAIAYRRGLGFFYPDSLQTFEVKITPYVSSLKINNKESDMWNDPESSRPLYLNYEQNNLSFEFSAFALTNGGNVQFFHRLTGVDKDWVASKYRYANYSKLPPGHYQLFLKTKLADNKGNAAVTVRDIYILSPWWKRGWAYLIYLSIIMLSIYGIYHFRVKRLIEQKEAKRLKEINDLKSRLYANITHEFRTPLTLIKGMTDEMRESLHQNTKTNLDEKLDTIDRSSDNLLHLVKQILDMSKIESGKMKLHLICADIISYLRYITESFQSMAAANKIKLLFYQEIQHLMMDYDPDKINIIASNLLSNAIKFTPENGKIIFRVRKDAERLILIIQDSGIGINEQHLKYIFDRFYQVDNSSTRRSEGTGIGLALTKELVGLMNGTIEVNSIEGEMTEFCIRIPISQNAPMQDTHSPKIMIAEGKMRLIDEEPDDSIDLPLALIIEDNIDVANYIISCLSGKYRTKWSPDGKQGIDDAVKLIPDIIISDVMMPYKDGFEVCETLKTDERSSHIPIILLTAKATEQDRIEGLKHGVDAYLTKPFNKNELFVRIKQLIKVRTLLRKKYSAVDIDITQKSKLQGEEIFLHKVVSIIEKNIDKSELDANFLSHKLNMSESQLYRKLKAVNGKSVSIFIREIRLSVAKSLLTTSSLNISEIAYQCGFNDPAWFSRAFKDKYNISPSKFRRQ